MISNDPAFRLLKRLKNPSMSLAAGLGLPPGGGGLSIPALDLNFLSETLDSRITFTRASAATRVNASGMIESVATNLPRFDYDPVTLAARGLLIEEPRTNVLVQSETFTTTWAFAGTGSATKNATGPDGVANSASTITDSDGAALVQCQQTLTVANDNASYTASVFIKKTVGATTFPGVVINLTGGTAVIADHVINTNSGVAMARSNAAGSYSAAVDNFGDFWRLKITFANNSTGNTAFKISLMAAVNADASNTWSAATTGSAVFYGAQLEVGAFATSYIRTVASQITRSADVATVGSTAFSNWFNPVEGTLLIEAGFPAANNCDVLLIDDGTSNNSIELYRSSSTKLTLYNNSGGVNGVNLACSNTLAAGNNYKIAYRYKVNDFGLCIGGATVATDNIGDLMIAPTTLRIGAYRGPSSFINGHVKSLRAYGSGLPDATLRSLTA